MIRWGATREHRVGLGDGTPGLTAAEQESERSVARSTLRSAVALAPDIGFDQVGGGLVKKFVVDPFGSAARDAGTALRKVRAYYWQEFYVRNVVGRRPVETWEKDLATSTFDENVDARLDIPDLVYRSASQVGDQATIDKLSVWVQVWNQGANDPKLEALRDPSKAPAVQAATETWYDDFKKDVRRYAPGVAAIAGGLVLLAVLKLV